MQLFCDDQLFVKCFKCAFGDWEVEYLGNIASQDGVQIKPKKFVAMQDRPFLKTLKSLYGYLGLIVYYSLQ